MNLKVFLKNFTFFTVLMLLGATVAFSMQAEWTPVGYSGGGRFTVVAVDPLDAGRVLVGSDVAGIFLSTDEGESFIPSGKGLVGFNIADIAFVPYTQGGLVMALTDYGLHISSSGGQEWTLLSGDVRYSKRCCSGHLFAFGNDTIYIGSDRGVFSLKTDNIKAADIYPLPGLENNHINALAFHEGTIFAATDRGVFCYQETWKPRNDGFPTSTVPVVTDLVVHPDGRLFAVEKNSGVYEWSAGRWLPRPLGFTLEGLYRPMYFKSLGVHPRDSSIMILATHPNYWPHRLFMTWDRGLSWSPLDNFNIHPKAVKNWATGPVGVESIAFSTKNPETVFIADWWNLWKSSDGGRSWYNCYKGLQNTVVNDIKQNPGNSALIYASVADNGLMVSPDSGNTWKRKMEGLPDGHAQEVEISKSNPNKIYVLLNPWNGKSDRIYVYRSLDGGKTWRDIGFRVATRLLTRASQVTGNSTCLELDPESDDIVYVATNGRGIYRTTNGGISWRPIHYGLSDHRVRTPQGLVAVPGQPGVVYLSTPAGVFKSADRGYHWHQVFSKVPTFGLAVKSLGIGTRIVAGCAGEKVALSDDGGRSWRLVELPGDKPDQVATYAVAFDPSNPDVIIAATEGYDCKPADGLFISFNGGESFERIPMPENLPRLSIYSLMFSSSNTIYVGFNGLGIYRINLQY